MSIVSTATTQADQRVLLSNISWATYEALVADTESPGVRFTYDHGYLEIMSPSAEHENHE